MIFKQFSQLALWIGLVSTGVSVGFIICTEAPASDLFTLARLAFPVLLALTCFGVWLWLRAFVVKEDEALEAVRGIYMFLHLTRHMGMNSALFSEFSHVVGNTVNSYDNNLQVILSLREWADKHLSNTLSLSAAETLAAMNALYNKLRSWWVL